MIIATNLLPTILQVFKGVTTRSLIPISMPFPYSFDSVQNKFYISESYPSWWWKVVAMIHIPAGLLQAIYKKVTPDQLALWELILRLYFIILYFLLATCFTAFHKFQSPAVCEYLNKLTQFEKRHVHSSQHKKWQNLETKLIALLALIFDLSVRTLNVLMPLITLILPKSPWNSYSTLYVLFNFWIPTTSCYQFLVKFNIFLANYFFFRAIMDSVVMCYTVNFMIGVYAIKCCLQVFYQQTTFSMSKSALLTYRQIQVLSNIYNVTHRYSCMVGIVVVTIMTLVTFNYMSLGCFRELHPVMLIACVLLTVNAYAQILVTFQLPTQVFKTSYGLHRIVHNKLLRSTCSSRTWMRRFWMSCPILKIEFFGNFFDVVTSLVCSKFCIDSTINLLLLKK